MWNAIFTVALVMGVMYCYLGFTNRGGPEAPPDIPEGTPPKQWPKEEKRNAQKYHAAKHWKAYVGGGLLAAVIGLTGGVVGFVNAAQSSSPSRQEIIDAVAADPSNGYDTEEATCMFENMDDAGIDLDSLESEDDFLRELATKVPQMSDAELSEFEACLDADSKTRANNRVNELSDQQLRQFFIDALASDPTSGFDRAAAECVVTGLEDRGLLRDLIGVGAEATPELDNAFIELESACT